MGRVRRAAMLAAGWGIGGAVGVGCAKRPQGPPSYVVPVIGLPPIPIDVTRPGLDVRAMPTAETMAVTDGAVRVSPEEASALLERRPVRMGYPAGAPAGKPGYVRFRVVIGRDGAVEGLTLVESTSNAFTRVATAAVQSWQYRPYQVNGRAVAMDTFVRVEFTPPE